MINFLFFTLIVYASYSQRLKINTYTSLTQSSNLFFSDNNNTKSISFKAENDFACTSLTDITEQIFKDLVNIRSDEGCESIKIVKCHFESIVIPENTQTKSSLSIIHIKNAGIYIENSEFKNCFSKSKISNFYICHAIYVEENTNHVVYINNCLFDDNGYESSPYGSTILINNSDNVQISFTDFKSTQKFSSAIQSINTKNINLTYNTFTKMIESVSIQFSNNASISDCIFDSNKLQPLDSSQTEDDRLHASALFVNLNDKFFFTNNTITNHDTDLNTVVTFNNNVLSSYQNSESIQNLNSQEIKTASIVDSKFINNKYSKSFDGSGIGLQIESSDFLNIVFNGCLFSGNGDSINNEIENAAGVLGWSKNRSFLSFIDCSFESNHSPSLSSLINVQNGCGLTIENCIIDEVVDYSFLRFSPLSPSEEIKFNQEICIQITNFSIKNTETTNRISNDLILIESDSEFTNTSLIISNCSFNDISLNTNNFLIHSKSNLNSIQIEKSSFKFNDQEKGSHILKLETGNVNLLSLNDCGFEKCLCPLSSEITVKNTVISDCIFTDCISDFVISIKSEIFECKSADIIFTSHQNNACSMGISISESVTASIMSSNFKNCLGIQEGCAIRCLSQNSKETSLTINSCTFDECTPEKSNVYTTNRAVNFINNTISTISSDLNGLFVEYMCQLLIDECTFTRCSYTATNGSSIKYFPPKYDSDVIESITIQNCIFDECSGRASVASIYPLFSHPKLINLTIKNSKHNFIFIIVMQTLAPVKEESGEVLLQNVSFVNTNPNGNVAVGGGGCGFWYSTTISDDYKVSFIDCHFENTFYQQAAKNGYGGGAICIQSPSCQNFHIQISSCSFKNCYTISQIGGAIAITTAKSIQIDNCYFEKCRIDSDEFHDLKGGAIYVNQTNESPQPFSLINLTFNETSSTSDFTAVEFESLNCDLFSIENCKFINCKTLAYAKLPYNVISCPKTVQQFECFNTDFVFDEKSKMNPRAVQIESPLFSFNNCSFVRCGSKYINQGGALLYDGTATREKISLENCYFDECDATNSGVFKFIINTAIAPLFENMTIQKIDSDYSIYIDYKCVTRSTIQFNRVHFIDNYNSLDGGGSGIWATNYQDEFNMYSIYVYFYYCQFINNYSPNNGGGYGIGYDERIKMSQLSFYSCEFIGNHCNGTDGGGALWIRTSAPCTISQCSFRDNYASELGQSNGGALYLSFATNMILMTISGCEFVNNSCPNENSKGHAIYSTLLYGRMEISYSNLTDNGIGCEYSNSVIYTRSEINIISSSIFNTNKEKVFSRAVFIGASSDLTMRDNLIANFSVLNENGGAVYYESLRNRQAASVDIIENTFINNTGNGRGVEIYLSVTNSPRLYNCTFINVNASSEIILIQYEKVLSYSTVYDRFVFINCDFNHNHFISRIPEDQETMDEKNLYMSGCKYFSCSNIPFIFSDCNALEITNCVFEDNTNDNTFFTIQTITRGALISDCVFKNNKINCNDENKDVSFLKINRVIVSIKNTVFDNEETSGSNDLNCFLIQTDCKLNLTGVSFNNCNSFKSSINFTPEIESYYFRYDTFCMTNCVVNNSGSVLLNDWTERIIITNTTFANSTHGLLYTTKSSHPNDFVSDVIQFENNVFDGFTNCALSLIVMNDINIENITIKNCQNVNENCPPIFELDIKNDTINFFTLDHFTFENNRFNNINNQGWMNCGGIGLNLDFAYLNEVCLNFVNCFFVSNYAENYGGGFCFIESNERKAFINFEQCHFKENTCNQNEGSSLYLNANNATINSCIFESSNQQKRNSIVYITSNLNDDIMTFSIDNCSFIDNQENSIHIQQISQKLIIMNCHFLNNSKYSILIENCNEKEISIKDSTFSNCSENLIYVDECQNDISVLDCTFVTEKVNTENSINPSIYVKTNSFIMKNIFIKGDLPSREYDISCNCTKSLVIENTTIMNYGGLYAINENPQSNIIITECTFSSVKHALMLSLSNNNFQIKNNTICDCINLDENGDKSSIIVIKVNSNDINLLFDQFVFKNNEYLKPKTQTKGFGGGGIGLTVLTTKKENQIKVEFRNCIFTSNKATSEIISNNNNNDNYEHLSGGAFYYVTDDSISLKSLIFMNCNFTKNYAQGKGGSLFIQTDYNCPLTITDCWFEVNQAEIDGAAVYVKNNDAFTMDSCCFINNSVSLTSASSSLIPADSLFVSANANVFVDNTMFIKLLFPDEESNVQTMFSIENQNLGKEVSVFVKNSVYSIINPTKSVIALCNPKNNGKITISNASFTHFYVLDATKLNSPSPTEIETATQEPEQAASASNDDDNKSSSSSSLLGETARSNETVKYVHIFIKNDLTGSVEIENSCFDTDEIYTFNTDQIGMQSSQGESGNKNSVSVTENKVSSLECNHPSILDELIDQNFDSTPIPPQKKSNKNKKKMLIIGLVVGIVGVILIVAVILVIVFIKIKKKKELEEKIKKDAEKEKETSIELDIVTNKLVYPTQVLTQENPLFTYANMANIDNNEFEENHEKVQITKDTKV